MSNPAVALVAARVVAFGRLIVVPRIFPVAVVAPKVYVVAAPPILRVVALALKIFPVDCVVVMLPPLTATLPAVVISPLDPVIEWRCNSYVRRCYQRWRLDHKPGNI